MRLWIDTDIGDDPDDIVALVCAQAHPDVEIVGVSVVGGREAERAELARRHVDAPVHEPDRALVSEFRAAGPEALLAIGPLTNVPHLLVAVPAVPLTLIGGVVDRVRHRGEVRTVEYNLGSDPVAAEAVLERSGAVIVPLDVTVEMSVGSSELARLVAAIPGLDDEVAGWTTWVRTRGVRDEDVALVLHDPLALLVCASDDAAGAELVHRALDVDATGRLVDGERAHDIVVHIDAQRALARVLELVG